MRFLLLILLSLQIPFLFAQEMNTLESKIIRSELLNESREYWVHIPRSYYQGAYAQKSYPVIFLLDAEAQFLPFVGTMNSMSSGANGNFRIPEAIVIGIPNTDRFRDFTPSKGNVEELGEEFETSGGGRIFLNFIENELIPAVDSSYRTINHRTLVGHSLGGLLATTSLFESQALFDAYMIIDPSLWWENGALLSLIENEWEYTQESDMAIYIATPEYADTNFQTTSTASLSEFLQSKDSDHLRVSLQRIPDVTHGSIPLLAFYRGLSFVYGDFQIDFSALLERGPEYIAAHYQGLSAKLGTTYLPPESLLEAIGKNTAGLPPDMRGISTRFFDYAVELYPASARARTNVADSLISSGDIEAGISSYRAALELDPQNTKLREKLDLAIGSRDN